MAASPTLLESLLDAQAELTAVERFAQRHADAAGQLDGDAYRDLIPLGRPGPGRQLAFRIDLDACTGCKACVTACHNLNGLDSEETWRDVGLLVGDAAAHVHQQTVTTTCHHCEDPACLAGCPVRAYDKDPDTGIVRHLDDQCIGCQYCVLKCPYDVPKYNPARGIVRKCDMCADRLADGEAPACVQGCPNGAISIQIVQTGAAREASWLPGVNGDVPPSDYTGPTTRYVTARPPMRLRPADRAAPKPSEPHTPLSWMLVLTQLSVGALLLDVLLGGASTLLVRTAAFAAALGLGVATLHLGRPMYAFRALLGLGTSWMSREIVVMGAYVPAVGLAALFPEVFALRGVALAIGIAGAFCSVMIYADTHRPFWSFRRSACQFAGTAVVLGAACCAAALAFDVDSVSILPWIGLSAAGLVAKLASEARFETTAHADPALARSARLLGGALRFERVRRVRTAYASLFALAATAFVALGPAPSWTPALAVLTVGMLVLTEWFDRDLYFRAEAAPGMPGT